MRAMTDKQWRLLAVALLLATLLAGCGSASPGTTDSDQEQAIEDLQPVSLNAGQKLQVVATTNIVGDVVSKVGGDRIELVTLMAIGVDPHTYVPAGSVIGV